MKNPIQEDRCHYCGHALQLYEENVKQNVLILRCNYCAVFHHYTKGWGGYTLRKASKFPYLTKKAIEG